LPKNEESLGESVHLFISQVVAENKRGFLRSEELGARREGTSGWAWEATRAV
jgi:hypothetical protein